MSARSLTHRRPGRLYSLAPCPNRPVRVHPAGNTFLQVSAEHVIWNVGPGENAYSYDVRTQETTVFKGSFIDVHDDVAVMADYSFNDTLVLSRPGSEEARYPELEARARFSPSGNYVLAVEETKERHGAAIVDIWSGELWRVGGDGYYPWIAWSYGDIALVNTEHALLACDAARRTCEPVHSEDPFRCRPTDSRTKVVGGRSITWVGLHPEPFTRPGSRELSATL